MMRAALLLGLLAAVGVLADGEQAAAAADNWDEKKHDGMENYMHHHLPHAGSAQPAATKEEAVPRAFPTTEKEQVEEVFGVPESEAEAEAEVQQTEQEVEGEQAEKEVEGEQAQAQPAADAAAPAAAAVEEEPVEYRRRLQANVPGDTLAVSLTTTMNARLAAAVAKSGVDLAANLNMLTTDRARVITISTTNKATADTNRAAMAATATALATARTATRATLAAQALRVLTARNTAKTLANTKIVATQARFDARTTTKNTEATRVLTKLNADKATALTQTTSFAAERVTFVAAHDAQNAKLAATTGHATTDALVMASRNIVSAAV